VVSIVSSSIVSRALWAGALETRKSLTADESLVEVFALVDLPDSIDRTFTPGSMKWMLVVPRADTPCDVKILVSK